MREKAKDESIHEGLRIYIADVWQGRKGSLFLSLSLSREDLIKFFWPQWFILKTIPTIVVSIE